MKRRVFIVGGALLAGRLARAADAELRLWVSLTQARIPAGSPIEVRWTLENISRRALSVVAYHSAGGGHQYDELNVSISRDGGDEHQVPLTGPRAASQIVWRQIPPGGRLEQEFDLTRAMELAGIRPDDGNYRLNVAYALRQRMDDNGLPSWSGRVSGEAVFFEIYR